MGASDSPPHDQGTEKWSSDDDAKAGGSSSATDLDPAKTGAASHYDFDEVVGRGGVGVVIKARDRRLRRTVAIKLIPHKDASIQARFEREAMLTARLQHPGIVPIYEAGRWPNGESYYAMRLIEGQALSDLIVACDSLDERLALLPKVVAVSEAVAYAHTQRVIHRDLKPKNVVVGSFGEVMVVDWGLAKDLTQTEAAGAAGGEGAPADEPAGETVQGAVMGTPAYMPPEQATGAPVDERADVYALGAMLYSVLTGAAPYAGTSSAEVLHQVRHVAPEPVEVRQRGVPRDLAAIVDKAMRREPGERYPDARSFAADLKRFVTGQLVGAHQYSRRVLVMRAIRRHPVIAAIAASVVVLVVLGVLALRRITAEQAATQSRSRALLLGQARALVETDPTAAVALLTDYPDRTGVRAEVEAVRDIALDAESRGVARHVLAGHTSEVRAVAFSPDGAELASADEGGALILWNVATGASERLHQSTARMDAVEFDPSGAYLAASLGPRLGIVLWDRRQRTSRVLPTEDDVYTVAFSPDGATIAAGSTGGKLYLWPVATGERRMLAGHEAWIASVAFAPDGQRVLSVSHDGSARLWTVADGASRVLPLEDQGYVGTFSRDGRWIAVGSVDGAVRVYAVDDAAAAPRVLRGDRGAVDCVDFSLAGNRLAWGGMGEAVYVADLATGEVRALHGHGDDVTGLAFLADDTLLTASADGTVRHWDVATGIGDIRSGHTDQVRAMAVSADGRLVASASNDRTVRVWPLPPAPRAFAIRASRESDFRAPLTNDLLAFYQDGQVATILDLRSGQARTVATAREWVRWTVNPSSTQLAYRDGARRVSFVDLATSTERALPEDVGLVGRGIDYTADGRTLVFPGWNGIYAVDASTLAVRELAYPSGRLGDDDTKVMQLQLSADGARALTAGKDLIAWDLAAGTGAIVERPPIDWPATIVGSPDLRTIAAGSIGGLAVHDGRGWRRLLDTQRDVFPIAFSPDGARVAAADDAGGLWIWRLDAGAGAGVALALIGHDGPLRRIAFSADGTTVVSAGTDGTARLWDIASGQQLAAIRAHGGRAVEWAGFRGTELVTAGRDGAIRAWPPVARTAEPVDALLDRLTTMAPPQR